MIATYQIFHGGIDVDPTSLFTLATDTSTRGHQFKIRKVPASSRVRRSAFAIRVVNDWNGLPAEVVGSPSAIAFAVSLGTDVRLEAHDGPTRVVFIVMHVAALGFALWASFGFSRWGGLLVVLGLGQMIQAVVDVRKGAKGPELIKVLGLTASVQLVSGLGLAIGIALTG